jgi:hypothetical protein
MNKKLEELRRQLDQKTTQIEALVAMEHGMGPIENMQPSDYEQLQEHVEALLEQWEEEAEEGGSHELDIPLNRLIAERFDIVRQILVACDEGDDAVRQDEVRRVRPEQGR